MKVNELMIGDWLFAIGDDGKKHICRANDIKQDPVNNTEDFSVDFFGTDFDPEWPDIMFNVEPIPLTPEILEKNGFVYNEIPFVQGWEQYGLTLTVGGDGFRVSCGQNVSIIIDFVHQLQHALRLCGIEKEIVL